MENISHDQLHKLIDQVSNASDSLMNSIREKGITYKDFQELQEKYSDFNKISKEALEEALRIGKLKY